MDEQASRIDDALILGLKRGVRGLYTRFQTERPPGTPGDGALLVLGRIQRLGTASMGELSSHFGVSGASMTQSVRTLENAGYVTRFRDPEDGRRVLVSPTTSGVELAMQGRAARDAWLRARLESLSADEVATLREAARLLARLASD